MGIMEWWCCEEGDPSAVSSKISAIDGNVGPTMAKMTTSHNKVKYRKI